MSQPELLTLDEAAERLGVHYMTAYRYVRTGRLPAEKVGAEWRVRPSDLSLVVRDRATPARRRRSDYYRRLEDRLLAGDEAGAWTVTQNALAAGVEPEALYLEVLAPALVDIGSRWADGAITVAQEHRASVVAGRLVGRLGPLFARRGRKRGTLVIGAPADDQHGLPTALLADLLRGRGFTVLDLGANTPAASFVDTAVEAERLVAVGLSATTPGNEASIAAIIAALRGAVAVPIVLGGHAVPDEATALELGADRWSATTHAAIDLFEELGDDAARGRRRARTRKDDA